jgi:hypothetical protein
MAKVFKALDNAGHCVLIYWLMICHSKSATVIIGTAEATKEQLRQQQQLKQQKEQ